MYANKRRMRTGPVFEGRFRSEPVNDSDYFITLLNYIHYNPVKARMTLKPEWYKWSSWREYELPDETYQQGICEQSIPFINLSRSEVREIVINAKEPQSFISTVDKERYNDDEVVAVLMSLIDEQYKNKRLEELPRVEKLALSVRAQDIGITSRQIHALLGVDRTMIYRTRLKMARMVKD